jgi:hypothetical protein
MLVNLAIVELLLLILDNNGICIIVGRNYQEFLLKILLMPKKEELLLNFHITIKLAILLLSIMLMG